MASSVARGMTIMLAFALALFVQVTQGSIECENLNKESCAFAVSSSRKRCVLDKHVSRGGVEKFTCRASEIEANKIKDWIETEECINACGIDRGALGISSDSLLEPHFSGKLCSLECYQNCPNIVDLYFNLAAGEGVFLPKYCEAQARNVRREMGEISSVHGAHAPASSHGVGFFYGAPAPSPYLDLIGA